MCEAQLLQCVKLATHATQVQLVLLYLWYEGGTAETKHLVYEIRCIIFQHKKLNTRMIHLERSPLTITLYYYEQKYVTFPNALKHPGGVVAIDKMLTYVSEN